MKKTIACLLFLSACTADYVPSPAAKAEQMAAMERGITDDEVIVDPETGADLQVVCDIWDTYVCVLPNGLPHLCRYCICSHLCWGNPTNPNNCDWTTCSPPVGPDTL